ncbi:hypothetical protein R6L23_15480 [Streptomyces sp. SR27]|uniref:hypothetical protein n=1 Tax=Streptomyces sp. SR27 TaxID=3076630 RepID=UPI00295C1EFF|nr:hypothetical protein [Streptomyces sp. SR27]MDV9189597.1 hypothetical protein [Streptomyces sp. SR27]
MAFNKSMSRTRKVCNEVSEQASAVVKSFACLHAIYSQGKESSQLESAKADYLEAIDTSARALDTRLNTGYRHLGTPFLPVSAYQRVVAELRVSARSADRRRGRGQPRADAFG